MTRAAGLPTPTKHRIVGTIVSDIALRRTVPQVYLLDGRGRPVVWPASSGAALPDVIVALVAMYLARPVAGRAELFELIDLDGERTQVRILPHAGGADQYALTLEPFVQRSRSTLESRLFSPTP